MLSNICYKINYKSIYKIFFFSSLIILNTCIVVFAQDNDYWLQAKSGNTKIFSIIFNDSENGSAESVDGENFTTTDAGKTWLLTDFSSIGQKNHSQILWKADIFCSIMKTTDGGVTWFAYDQEKQKHFCGVYFNDENTGYKIASDFLNKVIERVIYYTKKDELDQLVNHPQKCAEYYRNAEEGWALGWCIKNFGKTNK